MSEASAGARLRWRPLFPGRREPAELHAARPLGACKAAARGQARREEALGARPRVEDGASVDGRRVERGYAVVEVGGGQPRRRLVAPHAAVTDEGEAQPGTRRQAARVAGNVLDEVGRVKLVQPRQPVGAGHMAIVARPRVGHAVARTNTAPLSSKLLGGPHVDERVNRAVAEGGRPVGEIERRNSHSIA